MANSDSAGLKELGKLFIRKYSGGGGEEETDFISGRQAHIQTVRSPGKDT